MPNPIEIQVKFYATFRNLVGGNKNLTVENVSTVSELLKKVFELHPDLRVGLLGEDGDIRSFVAIMVNGRDIRHLDGIETRISDGDSLDIFPPVAGGALTGPKSVVSKISIRGLPEWLIEEYFQELGGRIQKQTDDLPRVTGDSWSADWSQHKAKVKGSPRMNLTQFDLVIEGSEGHVVHQIMESFMRKAQRGGG